MNSLMMLNIFSHLIVKISSYKTEKMMTCNYYPHVKRPTEIVKPRFWFPVWLVSVFLRPNLFLLASFLFVFELFYDWVCIITGNATSDQRHLSSSSRQPKQARAGCGDKRRLQGLHRVVEWCVASLQQPSFTKSKFRVSCLIALSNTIVSLRAKVCRVPGRPRWAWL